MAFNDAGRNAMLDYIGTQITYLALYTDTGATTEVTGGTYARKAVTWNAASGGSMSASNQPVFDVPAGTTVNAVGFMSAISGGTQYAFDQVTAESYGGAGTYTVSSATLSIT